MANDKHRPTRRDTLAWIRFAHAWHTPLSWLDTKSKKADKRHVEVECSCGEVIACEANADQLRQINVGFRDVPRTNS